ncbi:MAG: PAS domain S-box protein, partial [Polyangiaceae bacterium]
MDIAANLQLRVLNALPMHIVVIDRDGRLVTANRAWEDFAARNDAGGHPSVAPGANYLDVCRRAVAAGDRSALEALQGIEAVMDGHQPLFSMEYACHSPREQRWFSMTVAPLEPDGGGGAVVTHLDVTERRRAEEALRSSEERFRAIFECAAIGIAVADGQGQLTQCNQAGCDMLGYTLEELREAYRPSLLHPDDREANMAEIHRLMAGEINRFEIENRFLRKDGQPVWVHKIFSVLRDRAGQPECFISLITDTTARRNVEAALRESEERYRTIFEGVPIGIAVADPEGRIAQFNPAGCAMLGYTWEELRALHPSDLVYP